MGAPAISKSLVFHPLAMNSRAHWRRLHEASGGIAPQHAMRAQVINLLSPLWGPLRWLESACYGRALARTRIEPAPLFILGHWRTGTTHLHNVLSQDPGLGFVTTFQTLVPSTFLIGRYLLQPLISRSMPKKRPMDNVSLGAELPQEEEMAMANFSEHSFYVGWYFPERMPELFSRYVLFEGIESGALSEWKAEYVSLLKKAAYVNPGKRLVLKSPTNTGRIPQLLELFPDAKFLYIHRDPYRVFKSTVHLHQKTCEMVGFQHPGKEEVEQKVLEFQRRLFEKYEADKGRIPTGNLCEISYDDLSHRGMETLEGVYRDLDLPGWEAARPRMAAYLQSQADYEKNVFRMDHATVARIETALAGELHLRGYGRPEYSD